MSTYTQANLPLSVVTPLGKDHLLLVGLTGQEGLSKLFSFRLDLLAQNSKEVVFDGFDLSMIAGEGMDWIEKFQQYGANYRNWSTRIQQIQRTLMENIQFLQNVLDWSVQRGGLAELRSKQLITRPLETTSDGDRTRYRVMGLVVPAALFLAFGGVWALLRNRRRKSLSL